MAEYIEREAAKISICKYCRDMRPENCEHKDECNVMCRLDNIPAADVRPVVRGHKVTHNRPIAGHWADGELYVESDGTEGRVWVMPIMDNPVDYCSECGKRLDDTFQNFCPNCGADMRGEQDV